MLCAGINLPWLPALFQVSLWGRGLLRTARTSLDQKKGSVLNSRVNYMPTGLVPCGNGFLNLDGIHTAPRLNSEIPSLPFSGPCCLPLPGSWSFPSHHPKWLYALSIKTT